MKIIDKKHNGEINCKRYYETDIKIEIMLGCVLRSNNSKLKSFISLLDI